MPSELDYLFEPTTQTTAVAQNPEFDDLFEPAPQALPTTTNPNLDDLFGPSAPTSTQPAPAVTPEPKKPIKTGQFDPETIIPQIGKGILGGIMKFSTIGKTVKGMGDNYLQKANALNKEIDQEVSNKSINFTFEDIRNGKSGQAPDVRKLLNDRLDFQNNIEALNKSMNEMQDPIARQEIINQINKASMDVTNIDKLIAPSWKNPNEYKNLIEKFNQQRTLTEKANKTFQIGKNLEAKNERILNSFTTAEERDTFAYKLGSGIESMAEAFVTSKGVGALGNALKIAPKAVDVASQVIPGITLALPGAIDMYDKAIGKGVDPKTARMIAAGDLFANAALESVSFGFIFKGPAKGFIKSAITEGSQELAQTFTDNAITKTWIDQNQDLFQGALDSFLIGNIIGGSVGKIRANAEIPIMQNVMMRIKNNPKYQESFKAANMSEQDVDQLLQRVAQKTSEINEVVSEKTFTDEFNKTMGEIGKDQPEDAMRRKPIEGELDLNNPLQIEQAIADKNKFIVENEGNSAMRNMVAIATQERNDLSEKMQEVINRPNIELNPAEITQIQADIKESTGAQISQEQAAAIMREMSDKRVEQIKYQDNLVSDTGKRVQVRDENGDLQGVVGVKSQRRPELVGTNRNAIPKATLQQAADNDLINGYVEGDVKIPGNTEYIYSKAVRENSPELMKKVVDTGPEHIKFVLQGSGFNSVDELSQYATTAEKQGLIDNSPEVQNEVRQTKDLISEIKRIGERVEEAKRSLKQPVEKGGGSSEQRPDTYDNGNQGSAKSFAKVASERGGKGVKRMDSGLAIDLAESLGFDIQAVDSLGKGAGGGEIQGMAYPEYGKAKIIRALWKGDWGVITKELVTENEFQILQDAGIVDADGAIDSTKYKGKLGHLKEILSGVLPEKEIEALQLKMIKVKNTDELSDVISHEIGHLLDGSPDLKIDRGNIIGRVLSEINLRANEDIRVIGTNSEMRKELISLSEWWSPYNKETASKSFIAYRNKAAELYADALSVYINDPKIAKEHAPIFFQNFENNLFRKPGVKETLEEFEKLKNADKATLIKYVTEKSNASQERAENFAQLAHEIKTKNKKATAILENMKDSVLNEVLGDYQTKKLMKKLGYLTDITDIEVIAGKSKAAHEYLERLSLKDWVAQPQVLVTNYAEMFGEKLEEYIKPGSHFSNYMIAKRILNDRTGLANKLSLTQAQILLDGVEAVVTPQELEEYERRADNYYEFMDAFLKKQVAYGSMSQKNYDAIKLGNSKYAFFHVAEAEFTKMNAAFGNSIPALPKNQKGSNMDIRNPIASTVDLLNKMGWMVEINKLKLEFTNFLKEVPAQEDVIRETQIGRGGQKKNPDPGYVRMEVMDNSEYKSYDVKKSLWEEYDSAIAQINKLPPWMMAVRVPNQFIKMGLTKWNLGFSLRNIFRDQSDVHTKLKTETIPGVSGKDFKSFMAEYKKAVEVLYEAHKAGKKSDILKHAEMMGTVIPRQYKYEIDELAASRLLSAKTEEILANVGVIFKTSDKATSTVTPQNNFEFLKKALFKLPQWYDKFMTNFNELSENATKIAAYNMLVKKGFAPRSAALLARREFGTPDSTYGGKHRISMGSFFAFYGPTIHGNMRLVHAFTRSGGLKGKARVQYVTKLGVKMALTAPMILGTFLPWAMKRLWDDDPKKNKWLRIDDQKLERYFVLPTPWGEIRMPKGPLLQVMHKLTWEILDGIYYGMKGDKNEAIVSMKEFFGTIFMMGGVGPDTITPTLKTLLEVNANRDWQKKQIYNPNSSEEIKAQKSLEHILKNTLFAPIPKDWTFGFFGGYSGDNERISANGKKFLANQADIATEISKIFDGKSINSEYILKLASDEPSLISMAHKAIALSESRKGIIKALKRGNGMAYARGILNMGSGKYGVEKGYEEMGKLIKEARNVFGEQSETYRAILEFYAMFSK